VAPADGETLDQTWTREGSAGRDRPVPGLLIVFSGGQPAQTALPLGTEPLVVGRGRVGEVEIDDAVMSRSHAEVSRAGGAWTVRDLGSRNGTAVDGKTIARELVSDKARLLRTGDTLMLLCEDLRPFLLSQVERRDGVVIGPTLRRAWEQIDGIARGSEILHLTGETGSGKELAARRFHASGPRATGPFMAVNCATIPAAIAERVLFGARRGAYSGADADSEGLVQAASGGTLFLDEITELDLQVQAKLLRVIETREVLPLGAVKPHKIDLRFCSATHSALRDRVSEGLFREDLFFRVGRPAVSLPPLRERPEEIPWLIESLLPDRDLRPHVSLVEAALLRYWPGNVRELVLEIREAARVAASQGGRLVELRHLDEEAGLLPSTPAAPSAPAPSREELEAALARSGGNVSRTAQVLNVHRTQLRRWIERHGIDPRRFSSPSE